MELLRADCDVGCDVDDVGGTADTAVGGGNGCGDDVGGDGESALHSNGQL